MTPLPQGALAGAALLPGLADPVLDSQRTFRAVLEAMAHPGQVVALPVLPPAPAPLLPTLAALLVTLADLDTPVWLDPAARNPAVAAYLRFHCGCPLVEEAGRAAFAVVADPADLLPLAQFAAGEPEYPERSATVLVQVTSLATGRGALLSGPGIESTVRLEAGGAPARLWDEVRENAARFPLGVDLILATATAIAALPRSTRMAS